MEYIQYVCSREIFPAHLFSIGTEEKSHDTFIVLFLIRQDDDDGHLLALQIIRDLVDKGGDVFLDQLARLGVINKVSTLAGPASDDENEDEAKPEKVNTRRQHLFNPTQVLQNV